MFSKFQYNLQVPQFNDKEIVDTLNKQTKPFMQDSIYEIKIEQRKGLIVNLLAEQRPLMWVCLEGEDHDPGRFWLKFLASLRKFVPSTGDEILASLVDNHTQPLFNNVKKVIEVIHQNNYFVVLENISYIQNTAWWQSTLQSIAKQDHTFEWIGIDYLPSDNSLTQSLTQETISGLLIWDVIWHEWLERIGLKPTHEEITLLTQSGVISFEIDKVSLPIENWVTQLRIGHDQNNPKDLESRLNQLAQWLLIKEEWLEGIRIFIYLKEFEQAGDILEKYGESWLDDGFDRLEMLFWLRELPSVLLEARPQLCWLAAKACKDLNLKFLMSYYINHAENSLSSFSRFNRNQQQWMAIEINEDGMKVGTLMEKLNKLKI